jgi:Ca2+-binding RTX toxin-like protein
MAVIIGTNPAGETLNGDPNGVPEADFIVGLEGPDTLNGLEANDTLFGGAGDDTLDGGAGGDFLFGDDGNDILDGGTGDDMLGGGAGDDTYVVDAAGDAVGEDFDAGIDLVQSSIAYTLGDNVENLTLTGMGNLNGTGNSLDNTITGNSGNNVLDGSGGNDTLIGGAGNDTLKGGSENDVFKFSFTLSDEPGEAKTFKFTDWLSEKYGKDFGDELPDFERGHDHHHHGHHHHKHSGHHHHKHGGDHHHKHDGHHHHKHGGCDDHQPQQHGLSKAFFSHNYKEWLKDVVVVDLLAQGLELDANGNGRVGVRLNQRDEDGTPRIEGLTKEELSEIFGDRDEVTVRHGHHGHDAWYSNTYKSSSGEDVTTVASNDGFDTIVDFTFGEDKLELNGLGSDFTLDQFTSLFKVSDVDTDGLNGADSTMLAFADSTPADIDWGVTVQGSGHTIDEFYASSVFS